jgi:hypothetical protein
MDTTLATFCGTLRAKISVYAGISLQQKYTMQAETAREIKSVFGLSLSRMPKRSFPHLSIPASRIATRRKAGNSGERPGS